jgi:hypothetical protein
MSVSGDGTSESVQLSGLWAALGSTNVAELDYSLLDLRRSVFIVGTVMLGPQWASVSLPAQLNQGFTDHPQFRQNRAKSGLEMPTSSGSRKFAYCHADAGIRKIAASYEGGETSLQVVQFIVRHCLCPPNLILGPFIGRFHSFGLFQQ